MIEITAAQLVAHLVGDYVLQSDWMAANKTKKVWPAMTHALVYTWVFSAMHVSLAALCVIYITHYFIDRFRLARYFIWWKNNTFAPDSEYVSWADCDQTTGFGKGKPAWMSVWLLIITDNVLHVLINAAAISAFPAN